MNLPLLGLADSSRMSRSARPKGNPFNGVPLSALDACDGGSVLGAMMATFPSSLDRTWAGARNSSVRCPKENRISRMRMSSFDSDLQTCTPRQSAGPDSGVGRRDLRARGATYTHPRTNPPAHTTASTRTHLASHDEALWRPEIDQQVVPPELKNGDMKFLLIARPLRLALPTGRGRV